MITYLARGWSPREISVMLHKSYHRVLRELMKCALPNGTVAAYRGAKCRLALMCKMLGLTYKDIANILDCHPKTVGRLIRDVTPWGEPLLRIRIDEMLVGDDKEHIAPGLYRVTDHSPQLCITSEDGDSIHFLLPDTLKSGHFTVITRSIFYDE